VWVVFVSMFIANLFIFILGYIETKTIVNLLRIPFRILAPAILLLSTVGAYALRNLMLDVWVTFAAGIAGYFLRRTGYSIPGIILGVILGELGESAFVKSMQMLHYNWLAFFARRVCTVLLGAALFTLILNIVGPVRKMAVRRRYRLSGLLHAEYLGCMELCSYRWTWSLRQRPRIGSLHLAQSRRSFLRLRSAPDRSGELRPPEWD